MEEAGLFMRVVVRAAASWLAAAISMLHQSRRQQPSRRYMAEQNSHGLRHASWSQRAWQWITDCGATTVSRIRAPRFVRSALGQAVTDCVTRALSRQTVFTMAMSKGRPEGLRAPVGERIVGMHDAGRCPRRSSARIDRAVCLARSAHQRHCRMTEAPMVGPR